MPQHGAFERDVAVMLATHLSKDYFQRELHALTWKLFGWYFLLATLLVAAVFFIAGNVAPPSYVPAASSVQSKAQSPENR